LGNAPKASTSSVRHHQLALQFASRDLERVRGPLLNHPNPSHCTMGSQLVQELLNAYPTLEDQASFLEYGPHGGPKQTFEGTIKKEAIEVAGKGYRSPVASGVAVPL
jgi:hypothetical protein